MNHGSAVKVCCKRGFPALIQNQRWITGGLSLVVLVSILAMPACGRFSSPPVDPFDTLRTAIDEEVFDKERVGRMMVLASKMESVMNESLENIVSERKTLEALITDYDSSESSVHLLFADSLEKRKSQSEKYLALRLELKETATAEEWKGVVKAEHAAAAQAASHVGELPTVGVGLGSQHFP